MAHRVTTAHRVPMAIVRRVPTVPTTVTAAARERPQVIVRRSDAPRGNRFDSAARGSFDNAPRAYVPARRQPF